MCLPREHELPRVTADIFPHKRVSLNEMPAVQSHVPGKPTEPSSLVYSATEKQTSVWFHLVLQSFILFFLLWEKKKKKCMSSAALYGLLWKQNKKTHFIYVGFWWKWYRCEECVHLIHVEALTPIWYTSLWTLAEQLLLHYPAGCTYLKCAYLSIYCWITLSWLYVWLRLQ